MGAITNKNFLIDVASMANTTFGKYITAHMISSGSYFEFSSLNI